MCAKSGMSFHARIGAVAAGDLARAFEQMAHHGAARHAVEIVGLPAVLVGGGRQKQRRIGDAAGDDHVGAGGERGQQRIDAEIRVGRHQPFVRRQRPAGFEHAIGRPHQFQHVVAGHRGDLDIELAAFGDFDDQVRRRDRIGGAHVGDQPHALLLDHRQQQFHAPREQHVVAFRRLLQLPQLRERDRALGEAFEPQVLQPAALGEYDRRLEAVAGEAGAGADAQRVRLPARHQLPGRLCTSGKNMSCHDLRLVLDRADLGHELGGLEHFLRHQRKRVIGIRNRRVNFVDGRFLVVRPFEIALRRRLLVAVDAVDRFLQRGKKRVVGFRIRFAEFGRRHDHQRGRAPAEDFVRRRQRAHARDFHFLLVKRRSREMRVDAAGVRHQRRHAVRDATA